MAKRRCSRTLSSVGHPGAREIGWPVPDALLAEAVETTARRGDALEGFFRSTRSRPAERGVFMHDHMMVRPGGGGLLRFDLRGGRGRAEGWVLPRGDQLILIGAEDDSGAPVFGIFNEVPARGAFLMDGLLLACAPGADRMPTARAVVFERMGALGGDARADDAWLDDLSLLDAPEEREGHREDPGHMWSSQP